MKRIITRYILLSLFFFSSCGISEHSLPSVLEKGDSCFQYVFSVIQTSPDYKIGKEFIPILGFRANWGIGYDMEIGIKTFGLGLGPEIKYEFVRYYSFVSLIGYEFDFSFPVMGDIVTAFVLIDKDFLNFISKPFYFTGFKLISGIEKKTWVLSTIVKGGYLNNISFLPEISTTKSNYPGFWYQFGLSFISRENRDSMVGIGIESGLLYPKKLLYLSFLYRF